MSYVCFGSHLDSIPLKKAVINAAIVRSVIKDGEAITPGFHFTLKHAALYVDLFPIFDGAFIKSWLDHGHFLASCFEEFSDSLSPKSKGSPGNGNSFFFLGPLFFTSFRFGLIRFASFIKIFAIKNLILFIGFLSLRFFQAFAWKQNA